MVSWPSRWWGGDFGSSDGFPERAVRFGRAGGVVPSAERARPVECKVVEGPLGQGLECDKEVYLLIVLDDVILVEERELSGVDVVIEETDDGMQIRAVCRYDDCPGVSLDAHIAQ